MNTTKTPSRTPAYRVQPGDEIIIRRRRATVTSVGLIYRFPRGRHDHGGSGRKIIARYHAGGIGTVTYMDHELVRIWR